MLTPLLALAAAQASFPATRAGRPPGEIVIYRDAPCPAGGDNDVLVCSRPLTLEGARALRTYGACLAQRDRTGSRALLALWPGEAARAAAQRLVNARTDCAPRGRLAFSTLLLGGAIAERMLGDRPERVDPARPMQALDEVDYMSLCVIAGAPDEVAALVGSEPGGATEAAAFAAIAPRLDSCLRAGQSARLHRRILRAILALAAYRLRQHNESA